MGTGFYVTSIVSVVVAVAAVSFVISWTFRRFTRRQEDVMRSVQLLLDLVHLQENLRLIATAESRRPELPQDV